MVEHGKAALVGVLIGDSVGALFEGAEPSTVHSRWPTKGQITALAPSSYTGVSEMTAALAESLVADPEFEPVDFGRRLVAGSSRRRGYGEGTANALERLRVDPTWLAAEAEVAGRGCYGNGAAARVVPVGLAGRDVDWLRWLAEETSGITHGHGMASEGAVLIALGVGSALQASDTTLDPVDFLERLAKECQLREFRERLQTAATLLRKPLHVETVVTRLGNNTTTLGSVVTALYCFAAHPESFIDAVSAAASLGGNASSIAAMTGALSGAYLGRDEFPDRWVSGLERGAVTVDRLCGLAEKIVTEARSSDR
jgi:poly(ADP-ribose) glycohydrolase ARH3